MSMSLEELKTEIKNPIIQTNDKAFVKAVINADLECLGIKTKDILKMANKYKNVEIKASDLDGTYEMLLLFFVINLNQLNSFKEQFAFLKANAKYIQTWAIVDTTERFIKDATLENVQLFLNEEDEFLIRYGYVLLLRYSKDSNLTEYIFSLLKDSDFYYVQMAEAWLISYLLIYNFEKSYVLLRNCHIIKDIIFKGIQKAIESYRLSIDQKNKLRALRKELRHD